MMRRALLLAMVAMPLQAAGAAETVTCTYDAQGRVVKVVRTGSVNAGVASEYTIDKAGNRVRVRTTGAP